MATTRDQAYQQYGDIYRQAGLSTLRPEEDNDFEGLWKGASDSGLMQGADGQGTGVSWDQLLPQIQQTATARFGDDGGGASSSPAPAGAPTASPAVPSSSPRDTALQQTSQTYSASTPSQFTSGLRDALMTQLGQAQQPVSASDPQLAPIASAMRLENQRAAERKRSQLSAQLNSPDLNLGSSGAFDAGVSGILQAQGEANARGIGGILSGEFGRRGQALNQLLGMGLQSGEGDMNRGLTQYLGDQGNQRYYAGLGQEQGQFEDRTAFDYNALQQQGNLQALLALLNSGSF